MSRVPVRVVVVRPAGVATAAKLRDTWRADPLVAALAQLVRDRWANEQAAEMAGRERLRVVGGWNDETAPGHD